jgi:cystinosin
LDSADLKDFSGITGNPAKFGLGFVSIIFDLIFITQHYYLYNQPSSSTDEPLLRQSEQEEPLLQDTNNSTRHAQPSPSGPEVFMV